MANIAGLQCFGPDGSITGDVTDKYGLIIGQMNISGWGTMQWPYPGVQGRRAVYCISNRTVTNNVFSFAFATMDQNTGLITYDQGGDTLPMTLVFYVY